MTYKIKKEQCIHKFKQCFSCVETLIIALSCLFAGLNFIVCGLYYSQLLNGDERVFLVCFGLAWFVMIPFSIIDSRKDRHKIITALSGVALHLVVCYGLARIYSYMWMFVCMCEIFVGVGVIVVAKKYLV